MLLYYNARCSTYNLLAAVMHAFLISSGTKEKRLEEIEKLLQAWKTGKFDQVTLVPSGNTLTIGQVRELINRLELVPYRSPFTVGIIYDARLLTLQAQAALLKTLEEPPAQAKLILETENVAQLLPTITSRCQIIDLGAGEDLAIEIQLQTLKIIKHLCQTTPGRCLAEIERLVKGREEAVDWVDQAIAALHQLLLAQFGEVLAQEKQLALYAHLPTTKLLRQLLLARSQLAVNVNPKLVLDQVFLDPLIA